MRCVLPGTPYVPLPAAVGPTCSAGFRQHTTCTHTHLTLFVVCVYLFYYYLPCTVHLQVCTLHCTCHTTHLHRHCLYLHTHTILHIPAHTAGGMCGIILVLYATCTPLHAPYFYLPHIFTPPPTCLTLPDCACTMHTPPVQHCA